MVPDANNDPLDECHVLLYSECEFCCGLFPREIVKQHVDALHANQIRYQSQCISVRRRLFACTEVSETDFVDESDACSSGSHALNSSSTAIESEDNDTTGHQSDVGTQPDPNWTSSQPKRLRSADDDSPHSANKRRKMQRNRTSTLETPTNHHEMLFDQPQTSYATEMTWDCGDLNLNDRPEVPRSYGTRLIGRDGSKLLLRTDMRGTKQEFTEWMAQYSTNTKTNWVITNHYRRSGELFNLNYVCRHSGRRKHSSFNYGCEARIHLRMTIDGHCEIMMDATHNHSEHKQSCKRASPETVSQIMSFFGQGMDSHQARCHLELLVRQRPDFTESMLNDVAVLPRQMKFLSLYHQFLKENPDFKKPYRDYHPFKYRKGWVDGVDKEERLRVLQETARQFDQYFLEYGMKPNEARKYHEQMLRKRPDFKEDWLKDTAYMPTVRQAQYFSEKHKYYRMRVARRMQASQAEYVPELEDEAILGDDANPQNIAIKLPDS